MTSARNEINKQMLSIAGGELTQQTEGHQQVESIRDKATYNHLRGETKKLAQAAFACDCQKDYKKTFNMVLASVALPILAGEAYPATFHCHAHSPISLNPQLYEI